MKAYILSIAGAVLLSAVVSIVAPNGKMGKFVKGGLKLVVLVVLVAPFVSFFARKELPDFAADAGFSADGEYLKTCSDLFARSDEREVAELIRKEYAVEVEADVEYSSDNFLERKKITVKIIDFGIYDADEHINIMSRIEARLKELYDCAAEVLV